MCESFIEEALLPVLIDLGLKTLAYYELGHIPVVMSSMEKDTPEVIENSI